DGVNLAGLVPQLPPQFAGSIAGKFNLTGNLANLSPSSITGSGSGSVNIGEGRINLLDVELADGSFRTNIQTDGVNLAGLVPQLPPQFAGSIAGKFNLTGNLANLSPSSITGSGSGSVNIVGGTIAATNIVLTKGTFQATVASTNIQLQQISHQLRGILDGAINIVGNLANLTPTAITQSLRVDGKLNFSEGIPGIKGPLATAFRWRGDGIEIQEATAPGLSASGFVGINLNRGISPSAITNVNLDIAAKDINLQQIAAYLPPTAANLKVGGNLDFAGKIEGTIAAPNIRGDLELENLIINDIAFEPLLKGGVNTDSGGGYQLNLKGENDRIEVALGKDYLPISFNIRQGSAIAQGTRKQDNLQVTAQNFPINIIQKVAPLPGAFATQPLAGDISGNLDINLKTFDITVNNLAIAGSIFDRTLGNQTKPGNNQYIISGKLTSTHQGPQFQGKVDVVEGQLPVLVALWQLFDVTKANPRFPTPPEITQVGLPESHLQIQLRRFSEITALLAQQKAKRKETSPLPELSEIDGIFTGSINLAANLASGINAEFDIQGKDWQWGAFQTSQVIAKGSFKDSVLTLLPVRIEAGDSIATFSGTIGGETQSGKLQLENVPIALIREFVNLPPAIGFGGKINGSATLAGNLANPQARGELTVVDASLNQEKVQSVVGSFSYNNARLNFAADSILAANSDPITITGSIPYKLPFPDAISPDNNKLNLDINVKDKGLAILDILSRQQIVWLDGKGDVNVKIEGIFDQEKGRPTDLIANGTAIVSDAKIAAQTLPEPLTNVAGEIQFNFDQIDVKSFSGNFGGGQITASGTLPISEPVPQTNPLTVNIPDLALNLKGLYSGAVKGNITLAGAALAPVLTGKLELFNGRIPLPDEASSAVSVSAETDTGIPVEFNNLEITLGKDIQIRQAPILNFLAEGILTINGSLNNMKPKGEIDLRRGQVNIFTTQFRLAGGYNNKARFIPDRGFDPELDVQLVTSVAEATQRRLPNDPQSAEISDTVNTSFGSVQTVRVQAKVLGPASQLADRLELTSTPARSESEIVALLGGGFVDTFGRGDSTLGLANLAGSALLGNVGNFIGDTLRLSEFRLFPTIITNDERRTSSLGLAAEAGIDITRNLSISVLKELTTDQPAQYNLRYRINDNILLRGGTDFSGDSRAVIEYERRF
ncbi:translocation/assembly module TamB domain-containing protein, partial [Limnofasciculus baicalensis]